MNDNYDLPFDARKELQIAFRSFLIEQNSQFFATFNFNLPKNQTMLPESARLFLREFHERIDLKIYNRNVISIPKEKRTFFIAFPEHLISNFHYHLLMRVPENAKPRFMLYAASVLKQVSPRATLHLAQLKSADDVRKTSIYSCKDLIHEVNFQNFIISTEFLS